MTKQFVASITDEQTGTKTEVARGSFGSTQSAFANEIVAADQAGFTRTNIEHNTTDGTLHMSYQRDGYILRYTLQPIPEGE